MQLMQGWKIIFSVKMCKYWQKSTLIQYKLPSSSLLSIEYELLQEINTDKTIDIFAKKKTQ